MERNSIIGGALLLGLGLGYMLWGTAVAPQGMHRMPGGTAMQQNVDQHFIVQMIPHHEGAIAMARVALEKSDRPDVRSLARGIVEAQQKEIADMRTWYRSWFGSTPPTGGFGMMHMDGMTGDPDVLAAAPAAEFDREFVAQMIPHHEMAIMMAQMLLATTNRPEMKQLADDIIISQSREITMMRSWRASWAQ